MCSIVVECWVRLEISCCDELLFQELAVGVSL